jgi:hypothetical protein
MSEGVRQAWAINRLHSLNICLFAYSKRRVHMPRPAPAYGRSKVSCHCHWKSGYLGTHGTSYSNKSAPGGLYYENQESLFSASLWYGFDIPDSDFLTGAYYEDGSREGGEVLFVSRRVGGLTHLSRQGRLSASLQHSYYLTSSRCDRFRVISTFVANR